eukprot:symbB.v1.2.033158.t1/scaffold4081.1/size45058/3
MSTVGSMMSTMGSSMGSTMGSVRSTAVTNVPKDWVKQTTTQGFQLLSQYSSTYTSSHFHPLHSLLMNAHHGIAQPS